MHDQPDKGLEGGEGVAKGLLSALRGGFPSKPPKLQLTLRRLDGTTLELSLFNPGPRFVVFPGFILERKSGSETTRARLDANGMQPVRVGPRKTFVLQALIAPDEPRESAWRFVAIYDRQLLWGFINARRKGVIASNWTAESAEPTGSAVVLGPTL